MFYDIFKIKACNGNLISEKISDKIDNINSAFRELERVYSTKISCDLIHCLAEYEVRENE